MNNQNGEQVQQSSEGTKYSKVLRRTKEYYKVVPKIITYHKVLHIISRYYNPLQSSTHVQKHKMANRLQKVQILQNHGTSHKAQYKTVLQSVIKHNNILQRTTKC